MQDVFHSLFMRTWWTYDANSEWYAQSYHWMNLIEGSAWLVFAVLVLHRYLRRRNSAIELCYCLSFITFGLSDFREAYLLQSWLILFKGANLAVLLYLRWIVIRRFYPQSKIF